MRCSFLPTLPFSFSGFEIQHVSARETLLAITACALSPTAICPSCQRISHRVHSYYTRSPQDVLISGHIVWLDQQRVIEQLCGLS
jgi:hypothetical protein